MFTFGGVRFLSIIVTVMSFGRPRSGDKENGEVEPHDGKGNHEGLEITGHGVVLQFLKRFVAIVMSSHRSNR